MWLRSLKVSGRDAERFTSRFILGTEKLGGLARFFYCFSSSPIVNCFKGYADVEESTQVAKKLKARPYRARAMNPRCTKCNSTLEYTPRGNDIVAILQSKLGCLRKQPAEIVAYIAHEMVHVTLTITPMVYNCR